MVPAGEPNMSQAPDNSTHFGYREVSPGEKQGLVNEVFHNVAKRYDLMNDLMSGGLHRVRKNLMIETLNPPRGEALFRMIDVAGGTGDLSIRAAQSAGPNFHSTVCDIFTDLLCVGRERAQTQGLADRVDFFEGYAEALAFADRSFDAY